MDFLRRDANNQPQTARPNGNSAASATTSTSTGKVTTKNDGPHVPEKWLRIVFVFLLFSGTVLLIAIAVLLYIGKDREAKFIDTEKHQAVFLTNGQVYFGKIANVTDDYINLVGIYYLNSPQETPTSNKDDKQSNFSLVKLGCELHGPTDQMIINSDQVSFWENLTAGGKVAKAIDQFESQNPNGQSCSDSTNSVQQSQGSNPSTGASPTTGAPESNKKP